MSVSVCVCLKGNENIENQGRKGCVGSRQK